MTWSLHPKAYKLRGNNLNDLVSSSATIYIVLFLPSVLFFPLFSGAQLLSYYIEIRIQFDSLGLSLNILFTQECAA